MEGWQFTGAADLRAACLPEDLSECDRGSVILIAIGANVPKTYAVIVFEPLKNIGLLAEVGIRMIPLTIIALGIAVAYRSGIINIGAEGQMMMGILGACRKRPSRS